jgi:hypothetical protein
MPNDVGSQSLSPRSYFIGGMLLPVLGIFFLLLGVYLTLINFWRMGERVSDAVVLTGFVTKLESGQQASFGYGGDAQNQSVDVPFQSPEMSNVSFRISRAGGSFFIQASDDDIFMRRGQFLPTRERLASGDAGRLELTDGDRFEARGPLGRANFLVTIPAGSNELRLRLARPLYYDIRRDPNGQNRDQTRLVFAPAPEPIPSSYDELLFRSRFREGRPVRSYRISTIDNRLRLFEERELGDEEAAPPVTSATSGQQSAPGQQPTPARSPITVQPGGETAIGSTTINYRHYVKSFLGMQVNVVRLFAFKLVAAILLAGIAFLVGPHVRWPHGFVLYGCAVLFVSVALVLSGRDALFAPHSERFSEYLSVLYYGVLFLCMLRVSTAPSEEGSARENYLKLFALWPIFFIINLLISEPFAATSYGVWDVLGVGVKVFFQFVAVLVAAQLTSYIVLRALARINEAEWTQSLMWRWISIPLLVVTVIAILTWLAGGQEALTLAGRRIHLPTLLLPIIVVWISVATRAAEEDEEMNGWWLLIISCFGLLAVGVYRFFSDDNGGASMLAAGLFFALFLSTRNRLIPALLALVLLVGGLFIAMVSRSPRFGLAWGGPEVGVLYFDQAKNLRLARDMARAGGGGLDLLVPIEVRSNIHNDLIAAFIVGHFGWAIFTFIFLAFFAFYYHLFDGLKLSFAARGALGDEEPGEEDFYARAREILLAACGALILTFALQALWVMTASLQKIVPLTGLDLQPISISTISVLSFVVVLLGSVALAHSYLDVRTGVRA